MAETVLAAVKVGHEQTELREFPMPEIPEDGALLKVEAAGVCGSDVHSYHGDRNTPNIMGHENVGIIAKIGPVASRIWGVREGDRVAVEEYLPCLHCEYCRAGEYRHCLATDASANANALRYGSTGIGIAPSLWGGYSQYTYLPPNAVLHHMPAHVPNDQSALALPIGNGIQWACVEGGAAPGKIVWVMGPGQQGLGCVLAAKVAGADCIIVTGLSRDANRFEVAKALGADHTFDVETEDLPTRIKEATGGHGVDVVIDTTSITTPQVMYDAIELMTRKCGVLVAQGAYGKVDQFPIDRLTRKYITLKSARGHSYASVELSIKRIASGKYPLEMMCTHQFGLKDVDLAIKSTGGVGAPGAVHVTVNPWL